MQRYLRYRIQQTRGNFYELEEEEYRSYVDGTLRRFRYRRQPDGSKKPEFVGSRRPSEADWAAFFEVMDRYEAWRWTPENFMPFMDGFSWSLRVVKGSREVRVSCDWGLPPDFHEIGEAIEKLVHGADGQLPEHMQ